VENFVEIASQQVTTFCCCNTSSRLHSPAAFGDSLFDQSLACMKQRLEGNTKTLSAIWRLSLLLSLVPGLLLVGCVKRPTRVTNLAAATESSSPETVSNKPERININNAPMRELEKLPGIGKGLAERIVDHREKYGPFRRTEHLIIVRGISDRRFRALRDLITVE
jgi:competence ComEA-like helix-hairpin-helix protein